MRTVAVSATFFVQLNDDETFDDATKRVDELADFLGIKPHRDLLRMRLERATAR